MRTRVNLGNYTKRNNVKASIDFDRLAILDNHK